METPVEGMHPHSMQTQADGFRGGAEETVWSATPQSGTLRSFLPHPQVQGIRVGQSFQLILICQDKDRLLSTKTLCLGIEGRSIEKKNHPKWKESSPG